MGQFLPVAVSTEFPRKTDKMFSHVLSVAALASVAVAAPQYYYPALSPTYYTTGIAQPAAIAQPVAVETPAVAVPAVAPAADLSGLSSLAGLLPSRPQLRAHSTISRAPHSPSSTRSQRRPSPLSLGPTLPPSLRPPSSSVH